MPTLVIDNVPVGLLDRIQSLANSKQRTAADTALEALESAFRASEPTFTEAPLPQEIFLTEEICPPCTIPWPKGTPVHAVHVEPLLPTPHDVPEENIIVTEAFPPEVWEHFAAMNVYLDGHAG